jgi:hypothetical protein
MQVTFDEFARALPAARAIYNAHQVRYAHELFEHSNFLGRWIIRAETHIVQTDLEPQTKQEITDKLIHELATKILVSPYDMAPFGCTKEKSPVLFRGTIFPYWMLADILQILGNTAALDEAEPHVLISEMIEWTISLKQNNHANRLQQLNPIEEQQVELSESTALLPINTDTSLIALETASSTQLDCTLLTGAVVAADPQLTLIKLFAYRDLMKKAVKCLERRKLLEIVTAQREEIVRFRDEQQALKEAEQKQLENQCVIHIQAVKQQCADITKTQEATQNIMKEHLAHLIQNINAAGEKMKKLQEDCQNQEAALQGLIAAQRNLTV